MWVGHAFIMALLVRVFVWYLTPSDVSQLAAAINIAKLIGTVWPSEASRLQRLRLPNVVLSLIKIPVQSASSLTELCSRVRSAF